MCHSAQNKQQQKSKKEDPMNKTKLMWYTAFLAIVLFDLPSITAEINAGTDFEGSVKLT